LAAFGFEDFIKQKKNFVKKLFPIYLGIFVFLVLEILFFKAGIVQQKFNYKFNEVSSVIYSSLGFPILMLLGLITVLIFKRKKYFLIVLTFVDLFVFGRAYNAFVNVKKIIPKTKVIEFLQKDQENFRYFSQGMIFPGNLSSLFEIQGLNSVDTLVPINFLKFSQKVTKNEFDPNRLGFLGNYQLFDQGLMDQANVKYFLTNELIDLPNHKLVFNNKEVKIYKREKYLPRFYLEEVSDNESLIQVKEVQAEKISLEVESPVKSGLIISNLYYPGWEARINQKPVEIRPFQDYFQRLELDPGKSEVQLIYNPQSFNLGKSFSLATFCGLILSFAILRVKSKVRQYPTRH